MKKLFTQLLSKYWRALALVFDWVKLLGNSSRGSTKIMICQTRTFFPDYRALPRSESHSGQTWGACAAPAKTLRQLLKSWALTREFTNGHPQRLPACNFLSLKQYYVYNIFYKSLAGFLFKILQSPRWRKPKVALDICLWHRGIYLTSPGSFFCCCCLLRRGAQYFAKHILRVHKLEPASG